MVKTIGFRASPKDVNFAVFDADESSVVNVEILRIPTAFSGPEALKFVRFNILDVLREYEIEFAGIRTTEPSAQTIDLRRVQIEGVIQEAFASSTLKGFYAGPIAVIARRLGIERNRFLPIADGENHFGIENWDRLTRSSREALMTAIGAANV